uniref:Uncharacterized protein n=1 Tax=Aegilops tauschii subsp. strangulata TaxID=200361 RepID=A0A453I7S3_AEGTS
MASLVQHVAGLACPPLSGASRRPGAPMRPSALVCGTYVLSKDEKERERMRTLFDEASERCRTAPMEGITFSPEDLESAVETTDIDTDIGSLVIPPSLVPARSFHVEQIAMGAQLHIASRRLG